MIELLSMDSRTSVAHNIARKHQFCNDFRGSGMEKLYGRATDTVQEREEL